MTTSVIMFFFVGQILWWLIRAALIRTVLPPAKSAKELAPPPSDLPALACDALVQRVFEQRLVDAGIMTVDEMSVCEDASCNDCLPTHQAKTRRLQQEQEDEAKKKLRLFAPGAKRKRLKITENGRHSREIPWPESVPEYASIKVEDNNLWTKRIVFVWTDPDTARTLSKTMLIPVLTGIDADFTSAPAEPRRRPGTSGLTPERHEAAVKSFGRGIPDDGYTYS